MYLAIDLSEKNNLHLILFSPDNTIEQDVAGNSSDILVSLDTFFSHQGLLPEDLEGIIVVVESGTFTSTRLAVTVANIFGYVYQLPLLAITKEDMNDIQQCITPLKAQIPGQYITATYSGEPNIHIK